MNPGRTAWLALYGKILLLSLGGLLAKVIPLDATTITQLRSVVAVFCLLLFCLLQGASWRLKNWRQALGIYGLGVVLGVHWITYFEAIQVSTVAVGMLALYSYPIMTILLEPLFTGGGRYRLRLLDILAGLLVSVGLVVMVWDQLHLSQDSPIVAGCLLGVFSALLFAVRNLFIKYRYSDVPSGRLMLHQILAVALMLALFVDVDAVAVMNVDHWMLLLLLGLFATAGAHTLLAVSLKRLPARTVSLVGCSQPLLGALLAWLLLGEAVSGWVAAGGAIIVSVAAFESLRKH